MAKPIPPFSANLEEAQSAGPAADSLDEIEASPPAGDDGEAQQPAEDPPAADFSVIDY
jgi:hypothetical protein